MTLLRPARVITALGVALLALLGACSPPPSEHGATALVIGYHRNGPQPALVGTLPDQLTTAMRRGDDLVVVSVSGRSTVKASDSLACPYANNDACQQFEDSVTTQLASVVTKYPADQPEADLLGAINTARDALSSAAGPKQLIVIDNGLSTSGALDLRQLDVLNGDLDDLAQQYATKGLIHSLSGYKVTFSGLGQVADDQQLPDPYPAKLQYLWQAMVRAAGASDVTADVTPLPARAASLALPAVTVAKLPPSVIPTDICESFDLAADRLGFVANEATLRQPDAARTLLKPLADQLIATSLSVVLTGTTAYDDGPTHGLSNARAKAIKGILGELGVPADKILTQGVGINWDGYNDPQGNPQKERAMRLVLIKVNCPGK